MTEDDLNKRKLARLVPQRGTHEGDNGYLDHYQMKGKPLWLTMFNQYEESADTKIEFETRPAWFHLANYAFFNVEIIRLPVFFCLFEKGNIERIDFLDNGLSNYAREYIGNTLLSFPIELNNQLNTRALKQDKEDKIYWLWHNVGHSEYRKTLSYGEIANIVRRPRSSVQTSVVRFDKKLKNRLNNILLGQLLRISNILGLECNMTYDALVRLGMAPHRNRGIDSFDELDKLM